MTAGDQVRQHAAPDLARSIAVNFLLGALWLAARLYPLPQDALARVVLAEDGTALWRFADSGYVWC